MIHTDLKYISQIGVQLRNFKKKKEFLYNCSCPICGDSKKKNAKARGYFYQKSNSMFYKCHNCGAGLGVANFLKLNFPSYYKPYILEKYKSDSIYDNSSPVIQKSLDYSIDFNKKISDNWEKIAELPQNHYIIEYVNNRKIPKHCLKNLFFTENFDLLVKDICPNNSYELIKHEHRLIIPFYDKNKKIIGIQGRSLSSNKSLRYITIKLNSEEKLIYGLNTYNDFYPGYVVEGPIDSLFIPNCLAAANSDLESVKNLINKDLVLIYDNEPKNAEIVRLMRTAINSGSKICIWPNFIKQKDINDMIIGGLSNAELLQIIQNRTFSGLKAQLEFNSWRKI